MIPHVRQVALPPYRRPYRGRTLRPPNSRTRRVSSGLVGAGLPHLRNFQIRLLSPVLVQCVPHDLLSTRGGDD